MPESAPARVDFYVLAGTEARARLLLACRLAESAYLAGKQVLVWLDDATALQAFDDLLWTFADRSFVPHELFSDAQQWQHTPVLLSASLQPPGAIELLLNLGAQVPAVAAQAARIIELVDADESRRQAGRGRFRVYRERGLTPETHNIAAGELPQPL